MKIRFVKLEDIQQMHEILSYYINNTAVLFAYNPPTIEDYTKKIKIIKRNYPVLMAEKKNKIIGYAYATKIHDGPAYEWSLETTIYLQKEERNRKVGTQLYNKLEEILKKQNIHTLNAFIAYTEQEDQYLTHTSKLFHEKRGYKENAYFKNLGYKFNKWYDSIWMTKQINNIENPPKKVIKITELVEDKIY